MNLTIDEKTIIISALREQERRISGWIKRVRKSSYYNADKIAEEKERVLNHTRSALEKIKRAPIE